MEGVHDVPEDYRRNWHHSARTRRTQRPEEHHEVVQLPRPHESHTEQGGLERDDAPCRSNVVHEVLGVSPAPQRTVKMHTQNLAPSSFAVTRPRKHASTEESPGEATQSGVQTQKTSPFGVQSRHPVTTHDK